MIQVQDTENGHKKFTLTCELHPEIVTTVKDAPEKATHWRFVGDQCFCPQCKDGVVLQSFTCIGGVLLRRRRDLDRLRSRIDFMQEQIDAMPSESRVMTLAYDTNTARLDKAGRVELDVLVVQLIIDSNKRAESKNC